MKYVVSYDSKNRTDELDFYLKNLDINNFLGYSKRVKEEYPNFFEKYINSRKEEFKDDQDIQGVLAALDVPFLFNEEIDWFKLKYNKHNPFHDDGHFDEPTSRIILHSDYVKCREILDEYLKKLDINNFIKYAKHVRIEYPEFFKEYIENRKKHFKNNQDIQGVLAAIDLPFLFNEK